MPIGDPAGSRSTKKPQQNSASANPAGSSVTEKVQHESIHPFGPVLIKQPLQDFNGAFGCYSIKQPRGNSRGPSATSSAGSPVIANELIDHALQDQDKKPSPEEPTVSGTSPDTNLLTQQWVASASPDTNLSSVDPESGPALVDVPIKTPVRYVTRNLSTIKRRSALQRSCQEQPSMDTSFSSTLSDSGPLLDGTPAMASAPHPPPDKVMEVQPQEKQFAAGRSAKSFHLSIHAGPSVDTAESTTTGIKRKAVDSGAGSVRGRPKHLPRIDLPWSKEDDEKILGGQAQGQGWSTIARVRHGYSLLVAIPYTDAYF